MTWLCKCGLLNSGLNIECAAVRSPRPGSLNEHYQITENKVDYFMYVVHTRELNLMTPEEELFSKFYNHEKILVKDMDISDLREKRDQLAKVLIEAKARMVAIDDETREKKAKSKNKEWLLSNNEIDPNHDAINAPAVRKARMTKLDKMRASLLSAGIDEETVKEMMINLEKKATEKNLKTVVFKKQTTDISAVTVQTKAEVSTEKKIFDPSKLNFLKKT
jgi:hypothetical protein